MIKSAMNKTSMCVFLSSSSVHIYFIVYFLCVFVLIWAWITRTQKQKKHTRLQIHKASQIRSDHLGQNFLKKNYWVRMLNGSQACYSEFLHTATKVLLCLSSDGVPEEDYVYSIPAGWNHFTHLYAWALNIIVTIIKQEKKDHYGVCQRGGDTYELSLTLL